MNQEMHVIKKKICILGAFAVGKTSLIKRFIHSVFDEEYHTTIGVKIDQKRIFAQKNGIGYNTDLVIWDIYGEDDFQQVRSSYLIGASGYFLVADGTRKFTMDTAVKLNKLARDVIGDKPFVLLVNKNDLEDQWEVSKEALALFKEKGWKVSCTSAQSGEGVEEAFRFLVDRMI